MDKEKVRLDALESAFFLRQLESIDSTVYENVYPQYKSRMFIPKQPGIDPDAKSYTYRMYDRRGKAKPIGNGATDAPTNNVVGSETTQRIQNVGDSYQYDIFEIKAAAKANLSLDAMRADSCRQAIEELVDEYLSLGNTALGLSGALTLTGTSTVTSAGFWGTLATATASAVIADIINTANKGVEATDEAFRDFTIVMPLPMYNLAANLKIGTASDTTVLNYVKATCPFIRDVQPWYRCERNQAGDSTHDVLAALPRDVRALAAIVPRELEFLDPEKRGYNYVVDAHASTGGVVCRFPKAVTYCQVPTS